MQILKSSFSLILAVMISSSAFAVTPQDSFAPKETFQLALNQYFLSAIDSEILISAMVVRLKVANGLSREAMAENISVLEGFIESQPSDVRSSPLFQLKLKTLADATLSYLENYNQRPLQKRLALDLIMTGVLSIPFVVLSSAAHMLHSQQFPVATGLTGLSVGLAISLYLELENLVTRVNHSDTIARYKTLLKVYCTDALSTLPSNPT